MSLIHVTSLRLEINDELKKWNIDPNSVMIEPEAERWILQQLRDTDVDHVYVTYDNALEIIFRHTGMEFGYEQRTI